MIKQKCNSNSVKHTQSRNSFSFGRPITLTCSAIIPAFEYDSRLLDVRPVRVYAYKPPAKAIPGITAILSNANLHAETKPTTSPAKNVDK